MLLFWAFVGILRLLRDGWPHQWGKVLDGLENLACYGRHGQTRENWEPNYLKTAPITAEDFDAAIERASVVALDNLPPFA